MRTGKTNSGCDVYLPFAIVFPLVLSDLGVTKPSLLCHIKRVFQVTLGECQNKTLWCIIVKIHFELKKIYCCSPFFNLSI